MTPFNHLFTPLTVGSMTVKNRIFMAPMSTHLADDGGRVTKELLKYYEARAKGGVGFITVPSVLIERLSHYGTYHNVGLYENWQIENLKTLTDSVHVYGAKIGAQLLHPSAAAPSRYNEGRQPISASAVEFRQYNELPRALTIPEIHEYIQLFAEAAARARSAGFDAVEIHCCHSHGLLGNFLSPLHNKRIDDYGGNVENRARMIMEVIKAIRALVGTDFPIIMRMSACEEEPGGQSLTEGIYIAQLFEKAGASMIHLSSGTLDSPWKTTAPAGAPQGFNMDYAAKIRRAIHIPLGVVGRINEPWVGELLLEQGACDTVYIGRALISDPEFANKAQMNPASIRPCIGCLRCLSNVNADKNFCCTMNPEAGHELDISKLNILQKKKKILVVGGGPGGLTAATYAAERGHDVTLMERDAQLGGQMSLAAVPPCKQEFSKAILYMINQAKENGVKIVLNTEVTRDTVEQGNYDVLIVAAGSHNMIPSFLRGAKQLITAKDILSGKVLPGRKIVIIGGGLVGCETADYLLRPQDNGSTGGREVTIIGRNAILAKDEHTSARPLLISRLQNKGCHILTGAAVVSVEGSTINYLKGNQQYTITDVDTVISTTGIAYEDDLVKEVSSLRRPSILTISGASNIQLAITKAYQLVRDNL